MGATGWAVEKAEGGAMLLLGPQTHRSPCQEDKIGCRGLVALAKAGRCERGQVRGLTQCGKGAAWEG